MRARGRSGREHRASPSSSVSGLSGRRPPGRLLPFERNLVAVWLIPSGPGAGGLCPSRSQGPLSAGLPCDGNTRCLSRAPRPGERAPCAPRIQSTSRTPQDRWACSPSGGREKAAAHTRLRGVQRGASRTMLWNDHAGAQEKLMRESAGAALRFDRRPERESREGTINIKLNRDGRRRKGNADCGGRGGGGHAP